MLVCADIHLQAKSDSNLRCRSESKEEWDNHQEDRLNFIVDMANQYNDDLYIAGDIMDKAISPPYLTTMFIRAMSRLNKLCYIMPGNHCLPNHSMAEMRRASYGTLDAMAAIPESVIKTIDQSPYAYVPYDSPDTILGEKNSPILFVHTLVFASEREMPPTENAISARDLLTKYPTPKLIVCGDNHRKFIKTIRERTVLNCGCVTKRAIDFQDQELAVYHVNEKTLDIEVIPLPDVSVLVVDSFVEAKKESEGKFKDLVSMLQTTGAMTLDYVGNLKEGIGQISDGGQKILEEVL